jgi:hypothetical protein
MAQPSTTTAAAAAAACVAGILASAACVRSGGRSEAAAPSAGDRASASALAPPSADGARVHHSASEVIAELRSELRGLRAAVDAETATRAAHVAQQRALTDKFDASEATTQQRLTALAEVVAELDAASSRAVALDRTHSRVLRELGQVKSAMVLMHRLHTDRLAEEQKPGPPMAAEAAAPTSPRHAVLPPAAPMAPVSHMLDLSHAMTLQAEQYDDEPMTSRHESSPASEPVERSSPLAGVATATKPERTQQDIDITIEPLQLELISQEEAEDPEVVAACTTTALISLPVRRPPRRWSRRSGAMPKAKAATQAVGAPIRHVSADGAAAAAGAAAWQEGKEQRHRPGQGSPPVTPPLHATAIAA